MKPAATTRRDTRGAALVPDPAQIQPGTAPAGVPAGYLNGAQIQGNAPGLVPDPAALVQYLKQYAPASTPLIFYGVNNCAFAFGNNANAVNGNNNTTAPAGYLNPAGVPAAALETINAVIDRQSKTIDTLINLVEALTAKVDRLQNQIANQ